MRSKSGYHGPSMVTGVKVKSVRKPTGGRHCRKTCDALPLSDGELEAQADFIALCRRGRNDVDA